MIFTEPTFLFFFLPLVLLLHTATSKWCGNMVLLSASLIFYYAGEKAFVLILLLSVTVTYLVGRKIQSADNPRSRKRLLVIGLGTNLGILITFKYSGLLLDTLGVPRTSLLEDLHMPIGISFFTFQAISFLVDVYRRDVEVPGRISRVALYISLFPQLIAGPIVRYGQIANRLVRRKITAAGFAEGVKRFVIGLGKKRLIADTLARPADEIFALPAEELTPGLAWLGVTCYTLQIYFDFSGYSDMAIGMGRMLGFKFPENFRYPYVARSLTEFWRRWHMTLSSWFRDYLYLPLGGNRRGAGRTYFNLLIVFGLCGLWHGAAWTFLVWGLFHGAFLILERIGPGRRLSSLPPFIGHVYLILVISVGWVLFRAESLTHASGILLAMGGFALGSGQIHHVGLYLEGDVLLALMAGAVGSTPLVAGIARRFRRAPARAPQWLRLPIRVTYSVTAAVVLGALAIGSALVIAAETYQPFLYFRF